MEAVQARRAGLAVARRNQNTGPSRLAHRMFGHVMEASGRNIRHPWRWHRSGFSAPRERDRAIALRLSYAGNGEFLDAQWLLAGRRRENEQEPRKFRHHPRAAERLARRDSQV